MKKETYLTKLGGMVEFEMSKASPIGKILEEILLLIQDEEIREDQSYDSRNLKIFPDFLVFVLSKRNTKTQLQTKNSTQN